MAREVPGDLPVFVLQRGERASHGTALVGVFLHGFCGHGLGYLQSFQYAAAEAGSFVALQGDVACGGGSWRAWSSDSVTIDRRIDAALRVALGTEPPAEIVLIGVSQGVERAVALAARFPEKYRQLVLWDAAKASSVAALRRDHEVFLLAGSLGDQWPTRRAAQQLRDRGVRSTLQIVPGAVHGDFGGRGDATMASAFAFLQAAKKDRHAAAAPTTHEP